MPRPIEVRVVGNTGDAQQALSGVNSELKGLDSNAGPGVVGNLKKLGGAILAGGALAKAAGYLKEAALQASDMNETVSKTKQVFGKDAAGVQKWAKTSNAALLGTEQAVLDVVDGFALMLGNKGINGAEGRRWSQNLTNLSADLASFFNTDFEDAAAAVSSALRGEMDPIERYGVTLNDAALKAKAFELGLYSGKGALDSSTKSQAAYALIMEQTAKAQGDVERTQGGLANQSRIFNTNLSELKTTLGQSLVPLGEAILPKINTALEAANDYLGSKGFKGLVEDIAGRIEDWDFNLDEVKKTLGNLNIEDVKKDFGWLEDAAGDITDGVKGIWRAFDGMSPETKSNITKVVAAGAALKLLTMSNPVIKIGVNLAGEVLTSAAGATASAVVGRLFNSVTPMRVFVVNEGFDIGTPAGKSKLGKVLRTLPFIETVLTVIDVANAKTDENRNGLKEISKEMAALRGATQATAVGLNIERDFRKLGDASNREYLQREAEQRRKLAEEQRRLRNSLIAIARAADDPRLRKIIYGNIPLSAADRSGSLPVVTDEQIARAVYSTLMRSGIRNGTQVAV